jgi:hypothetical protein
MYITTTQPLPQAQAFYAIMEVPHATSKHTGD